MALRSTIGARIDQRFAERNDVCHRFFEHEVDRLATICEQMSTLFLRGGRLIAFGRGCYSTDAQHVSVEFVHPVIVGKRALPALDLSMIFRESIRSMVSADDIVMGFGAPQGDVEVEDALDSAESRGALTLALPGSHGTYSMEPPTSDPFIHQELIEILYHTLWETVHVFFEHRELGHDAGEAGFLYPFLGQEKQSTAGVLDEVARSIEMKAEDDASLRTRVALEESDQINSACNAIADRIRRGGKLIVFGNGGSATDANDFMIDCVAPPQGYRPIPCVSLSLEPANITAVANDVGTELIFLRQLVAQARPNDVAIAISTSGGSKNVCAALEEGRKGGLLTVALLGYDGGEIVRQNLTDFPIVVRSDYIPRIQEVQASVYHVMRESLEIMLHG